MPDDARPFLKLIQSEAAAGDPTVQQTVLQLADWLEERGDPRAGWLRGQRVEKFTPSESTTMLQLPEVWLVFPPPDGVGRFSCATEAGALQELARRVMEAMTRPCDCTKERPLGGQSTFTFIPFGPLTGCPACQGDGFLLAEAEACECMGGWCYGKKTGTIDTDQLVSVELVQCPDCSGCGWRITSPLFT